MAVRRQDVRERGGLQNAGIGGLGFDRLNPSGGVKQQRPPHEWAAFACAD